MADGQPRDRDLMILLKLEQQGQALQSLTQDVQSLAPLLEKIIRLLATQKTPAKPPVADFDQVYPDLVPSAEEEGEAPVGEVTPPQSGGWGRLFPRRNKTIDGSTANSHTA